MSILVAYASRHKATAEIAARIDSALTRGGLTVDIRPVSEVNDVSGYDAVVLGSAAYINHWLREATAFAKRHRRELSERPVWLFNSGPLGSAQVAPNGTSLLKAATPREFEELRAHAAPASGAGLLRRLGSLVAADGYRRAPGARHAGRS